MIVFLVIILPIVINGRRKESVFSDEKDFFRLLFKKIAKSFGGFAENAYLCTAFQK